MRATLPAVLIASLAAALAPASALAEGTMCLEVPPLSLPQSHEDVAWIEDGLDGGLSGISIDESVWVVVAPPAGDEGPVLWCSTRGDPRCWVSNPPGHDRPQIDEVQLRAEGTDHPEVADAGTGTVTFEGEATHPRSGHRSRIDRPPQA